MTNGDPVKEWGLPDWRDVQSYSNAFGPPSHWSEESWRWEFKRRQPEYRQAFDALVLQGLDGTIHRDSITKRDDQGNLVMVEPRPNTPTTAEHASELGFAFVADDEHRHMFNMLFLPNPRFSEQPASSILFGERLITAKRDENGLLVGEAQWRFDLTKPLKAQLRDCEAALTHIQVAWKKKKVREPKRDAKWLEYLRALDAKECDAVYREMLIIIPHKHQVEQSARDTVAAAIALRNKL